MLSHDELADDRIVREIFKDITDNIECRCLIGESLAKHTSFRIGGPAAFYVFPADRDALRSLLQLCDSYDLNFLIIGFGNNLLVSDAGFPGCVIDLKDGFSKLEVDENRLTADSGVWLGDVVKLTAEKGLCGMEKLAGIPGSVGGGMSMNCGAFRTYISDRLTELEVMDMKGKIEIKTRPEIDFGYRTVPALKEKIVLNANFQMEKASPGSVVLLIEETISERFKRHVMTLPSAGSVFKNPEGEFAARLLDSLSVKGIQIGGAKVSLGHANIIVNNGVSTAGDVVDLIGRLREMVYKRFGIELKLEIKTIGFEYVIDA